MRPMERSVLSRDASEQIKQYILDKRLKPGDKLPTERDLTEVLQVSRTVVREALSNLETLGIISKRQGKGIFIAENNWNAVFSQVRFFWEQSKDNLDQLVDFRIILELAAVESIIDNQSDVRLAELEDLVEQSKMYVGSFEKFAELDYRFHSQLLKLTGNELFYSFTDMLTHFFYLVQTERKPTTPAVSLENSMLEHAELIDHIRAKNAEQAKRLLKEHLMAIKKPAR
jgi:GntR family transcriptional repressor for pyruvate dehydrogenase complex